MLTKSSLVALRKMIDSANEFAEEIGTESKEGGLDGVRNRLASASDIVQHLVEGDPESRLEWLRRMAKAEEECGGVMAASPEIVEHWKEHDPIMYRYAMGEFPKKE